MSKSRTFLGAALLLSTFACGGTARLEGGPGADTGAGGLEHAGASNPPSAAGASNPPSAAGAPQTAPGAGAPEAGGSFNAGGNPNVAGALNVAGSSNIAGNLNIGGMFSVGGSPGAGGDGSCHANGTTYPNGVHWKCDCNDCWCSSGQLWSTAVACSTCQYAGKGHYAGDSFLSLDGCNTCSCDPSGTVSCTQKACQCDPSSDGPLHYLITDPKGCARVDYACPDQTQMFQNECGCGCAQAADCPLYIDCAPGPGTNDCASLKVKCPYSKLAL